ncbi:MAG: CHAT domain-containing protein [Microbacterium sp.]|uniref:CHAT domain-containing protein n=1 Tax=Microbacterium sp. TaxID=51671 RepID=UPI003F80679F
MTSTGASLHRRGVAAANQGRYAEARRLLDAAAVRADDDDLRARIAGTMAYITARTGDLSGAERMCRSALETSGISAETRAILLGQLGALAEQAGRLDDAELLLSEAISSIDDQSVVAARMLVTRSLVNMSRRRLDLAAADADAAISVYERQDMAVEAAQIRHNVGYIALLRGDLVVALREMMVARRALMDVSEVTTAICDVDRAQVLRDAGLTTEAERLLERAAVSFGRRRMPQARAEAEFELARSLLSHSVRSAATVAGRAQKGFRRIGHDTWAARAEAVRLRAQLSGGRTEYSGTVTPTPRRRVRAEEVDAVANRLLAVGFPTEAAALRLTHDRAAIESGDADVAPVRLAQSAPMELQLLAAEVRAARAAKAGHPATARRRLAEGLDALTSWQQASGSIDLQTSVTMHGSALMYAGITSAVRSGRAETVFEWSERARHLSQQVAPLRPPPDRELARELAELRMLRLEDSSGDWLSGARAATLREQARARQWSATGTRQVDARVDLKTMQGLLTDDSSLVSFVFTGDEVVGLVVTGESATLVRLSAWGPIRSLLSGLRADLDMAASIRTGPMAAVVKISLNERLADLCNTLLEPMMRVAGSGPVVLTVPGVLNGVPWSMLPSLRGRAFTLAASATRWAAWRDEPPTDGPRAGFAVGPRVERGQDEVSRAARMWPRAVVLSSNRASASAVTELAEGVDVLHIAAHGRHAVDNPMFSGLELADGTLFGYDIDLIENVPDTVILSACEVGRSSVRWGEEAIGMTRVWLHAGARCVVAAPVVVADDDACELLAAMHEGLAAGIPPSVALAEASERTGIVAPFQVHGAGF